MKKVLVVFGLILLFVGCTTNEDRLESISELVGAGDYEEARVLIKDILESEPSVSEKEMAKAWLSSLDLRDDSNAFYSTENEEEIAQQIIRIIEHQEGLTDSKEEPYKLYARKVQQYQEIIADNLEVKMHSIQSLEELNDFIKFLEGLNYSFEIDSNDVVDDIYSLVSFLDSDGKNILFGKPLLRTVDYLEGWVDLKEDCAKLLMKMGKQNYYEGNYETATQIFNTVINVADDKEIAREWRNKAKEKREEQERREKEEREKQKRQEEIASIKSSQNSYTNGSEVAVAVGGVELNKYLGSYYTYGNARYLLVFITVKNISNARRHVNPNDFSIADQWGNTCSYDTATFSMGNYFDATDLNPGNQASGWLAFVVNKDSWYYTLYCDDTYGTSVIKKIVVTD